jgi:uncharacterized SAM-binding protein YcdF (DUF218 family)
MEALIVLTSIGIAWIVSSRRWKRWFVMPVAVLIVLYLIVTSHLFLSLARSRFLTMLPPDSGATVDAIVVLGRGEEMRQSRVEVAANLWRQKRAPQIFASGMSDAQQIIDALKDEEIAKQSLSGEYCSESTQENALFTAAVLFPERIQTILLVTDIPHLPRAFFLFRRAGFDVLPHASPLPSFWNSRKRAQIVLRELTGLLVYTVETWLQPQSANQPLNQPQNLPVEVLNRLKEWQCQIQG